MSHLRHLLLGILTLSTSMVRGDSPDIATPNTYRTARQVGRLRSSLIRESSGLASCLADRRFLWTHNDSGGKPRLFLITERGRLQHTYSIGGARAVDWEDLCSFQYRNNRYLLIGDVGDNRKQRPFVTLYLLREPNPLLNASDRATTLPLFKTIRLEYPNGARDCEAIAVDPASGTAYLVEKRLLGPVHVYAVPLFQPATAKRQVAQIVTQVSLALVTAMDISPNGQTAILLTYGDALTFPRGQQQSWKDVFSRRGRQVRMPARRQGEAICFGADGQSLYLTSEGTGQPIWKLETAPR
ncbi:MAG: hypothetical protein VX346_04735 [Planctomycetota bacterium]|nr:hypothetical protein [Planctomycetota bacterium]